MPYKNINDIPLITQIAVFFVGLWTSLVNFFRRDGLENYSLKRKLITFTIDLISSFGFTVIVFLTLTGYGLNEVFSVGIAGIMGHQGTRAIYLMELIILEKVGARKTYEKRVKDG